MWSPDGLYRFSSGFGHPVAHVWFSHSLIEGQPSTYIIYDCPKHAKEIILSYVKQGNSPILMRRLSIDALLAEHDLHQWGQEAIVPRNQLVAYVRFHPSLQRAMRNIFIRKKPQFYDLRPLKLRKRSRSYIPSPRFFTLFAKNSRTFRRGSNIL